MGKFKITICTIAMLLLAFTPAKKEEHIDHIILAINNLEKGISEFKERTGIEPVFGGVHPNSFTHNALVALDGETYIEIMAPRPDAQDVPADFTKLEKLTPVGWATRTQNIELTKKKLKAIGFITTENREGSRAKPDGSLLRWTTFGVESHDEFPFFIQWSDATVHPSASSPAGCTLKSLRLIAPDPKSLQKLNNQLALGLDVVEGKDSSMVLTLNSPKGLVIFSSNEPPKK